MILYLMCVIEPRPSMMAGMADMDQWYIIQMLNQLTILLLMSTSAADSLMGSTHLTITDGLNTSRHPIWRIRSCLTKQTMW